VNESLQKRGTVKHVALSGGQWRTTSAGEQIWKIWNYRYAYSQL